MAKDRQAEPELGLEVDVMILDYLVCSAIKRVVDGRVAERSGDAGQSCETHLQMVDGK